MLDYDPQKALAVFLGPSLARVQATLIADANYYPPVQMGDIYRLLGSGVGRIVIIDGLFHGPAAVWQREILEALDNGIEVVGAASMGALRAAELYPLGMVGHGTIFEWYRTGLIDGDDEVALLHGDEAVGFQPFSEPLVNLRYNLQQAAIRGVISLAQAEELIEYLKTIYYAERSYPLLLGCKVVTGWPLKTQNRLQQFIKHEAINLKEQDAINTLWYCATTAPMRNCQKFSVEALPNQNLYYQLVSYQHRGFLQPTGNLVSGKTLLDIITQDATLYKTYRPVLVKNFFLLQWAKQKAICCPAEVYESYRKKWWEEQNDATYLPWLRANGLTEREFHAELAQRALVEWLIAQSPVYLGLEHNSYAQFIEVLLPELSTEKETLSPQKHELWVEAVETCYLTAWARENGIACPAATVEAFIERWEAHLGIDKVDQWLRTLSLDKERYQVALAERALSEWLIDKGPRYFGYASWSFEVALIKELQITGRVAQLIASIGSGA